MKKTREICIYENIGKPTTLFNSDNVNNFVAVLCTSIRSLFQNFGQDIL